MAENHSACPMQRGQYLTTCKDSLLGKRYLFPDRVPGAPQDRSYRDVEVMLVKSAVVANITPKAVLAQKADGTIIANDGVISALAADQQKGPKCVADEYLPAAGVPTGAYFLAVVSGPSKVVTVASGTVGFAVGDRVVAATGGRVREFNVPGIADTVAALTPEMDGLLGRALQTVSTNDADVVIDVGAFCP